METIVSILWIYVDAAVAFHTWSVTHDSRRDWCKTGNSKSDITLVNGFWCGRSIYRFTTLVVQWWQWLMVFAVPNCTKIQRAQIEDWKTKWLFWCYWRKTNWVFWSSICDLTCAFTQRRVATPIEDIDASLILAHAGPYLFHSEKKYHWFVFLL